MNFYGKAEKLTQEDIAEAAINLNCHPAVIRAVCDVEAAGSGFLSDGRPKILPEAHRFYRWTNGRFGISNISSPRWDRSLYGKGGAHQYDRLAKMIKLDEEAALKSTSWGMFQVLGENAISLGYSSVHDMVEKFLVSEGNHLDGFVRFSMVNNLADDLAATPPRFAAFARGYNGPGYAQNGYDVKLEAAWRKHLYEAKPAPSPMPRTDPVKYMSTLQSGLFDHSDVAALQEKLRKLSYDISVDGDFGPDTMSAVVAFQRSQGLRRDGIVGPRTHAAIDKAIKELER